MAEDPPGSWPLPENVALPDESDDKSLVDGASSGGEEASDVQDNDIATKGRRKESSKKKYGMMALPSEIRETYAFRSAASRMPVVWLVVILLMLESDIQTLAVSSTSLTRRRSPLSSLSITPGAPHRKRLISTLTTSPDALPTLVHTTWSAGHSQITVYPI